MKTIASALVLSVSLAALVSQNAQQTATPPDFIAATSQSELTPAPTDCTKFRDFLPGCKSFNEMLEAKDKDITGQLSEDNNSYVCFRTDEDVFSIISVQRPALDQFKKVAGKPDVSEMFAFSTVSRYKNGVSQDWRLFTGNWSKPTFAPVDRATYSAHGGSKSVQAVDKSSLDIDDSEISVVYRWKNLRNTITTYTMKIRRSTHRLLETVQAPPGLADKDRSVSQSTMQGYCVDYNFH